MPGLLLGDLIEEAACNGVRLSENADECKDADARKATYDSASTKLEKAIKAIINLLSIIAGIIAVIMLIVNGLRFITAAGDSNAITSARNGVIYALVGLTIAVLAQVIVRFVLTRI